MKTILCDIGGVLLNVDFDRALSRLADETGLRLSEIREKIFLSGMKDRHDAGEVKPYALYRHAVPERTISFDRFREIWGDIFAENRDMVDYVTSCAGPYRLYIASNTDPLHYQYFHDTYPWFSLFQGYGLSFELKCLKPAHEFYEKLCEKFSIEKSSAFFVDDLKENVDAAAAIGIRAHHFSGVEGFRNFLENV